MNTIENGIKNIKSLVDTKSIKLNNLNIHTINNIIQATNILESFVLLKK